MVTYTPVTLTPTPPLSASKNNPQIENTSKIIQITTKVRRKLFKAARRRSPTQIYSDCPIQKQISSHFASKNTHFASENAEIENNGHASVIKIAKTRRKLFKAARSLGGRIDSDCPSQKQLSTAIVLVAEPVSAISASENTVSASQIVKFESIEEEEIYRPSSSSSCSPRKRNRCPGLRIVHGRIYDSERGKTCHQCRQKTMDFSASCKIPQCPFHYCHKCLHNRYGENAEEVAVLDDWRCPKCRGICNCSFCMKKRGWKPTGNLKRTAKSIGFSSVAEMLRVMLRSRESEDVTNNDVDGSLKKGTSSDEEELGEDSLEKHEKENGFEEANSEKIMEDTDGSRNNSVDPNEGSMMASPRGCPEGKGLNGEMDPKSHCKPSKMNVNKNETVNCNLKRVREEIAIDNSSDEKHACTEQDRPKRRYMSKETPKRKENICKSGTGEQLTKMNSYVQDFNDKPYGSIKIEENENTIIVSAAEHQQVNEFRRSEKNVVGQRKDSDVEILLPQGMELKNVANIDLPAEDIGHALQFLEFCEAFGKVLHLKKGESESLLQEIASGVIGHDSSIVQFHIKLLSMIQKDSHTQYSSLKMEGKDSWLQLLTNMIPKYQCLLQQLDLGCIHTGAGGYDELTSSKRLRLVNFLCDEALETSDIRSWIDEQNLEFNEEEKKKALIEKQKDKNVKKSLQDEVARFVLVQNGTPLSISEHDDLISKIKAGVAQTLAETQESAGTMINKKQRSDAVRAEPILSDAKGRKFWKLRGHSGEMGILLQDLGSGDLVSSEERWFTYDVQEKANVEKYISRQLRK